MDPFVLQPAMRSCKAKRANPEVGDDIVHPSAAKKAKRANPPALDNDDDIVGEIIPSAAAKEATKPAELVDDVVGEIVARLPKDSLFKLMHVSKAWRNIVLENFSSVHGIVVQKAFAYRPRDGHWSNANHKFWFCEKDGRYYPIPEEHNSGIIHGGVIRCEKGYFSSSAARTAYRLINVCKGLFLYYHLYLRKYLLWNSIGKEHMIFDVGGEYKGCKHLPYDAGIVVHDKEEGEPQSSSSFLQFSIVFLYNGRKGPTISVFSSRMGTRRWVDTDTTDTISAGEGGNEIYGRSKFIYMNNNGIMFILFRLSSARTYELIRFHVESEKNSRIELPAALSLQAAAISRFENNSTIGECKGRLRLASLGLTMNELYIWQLEEEEEEASSSRWTLLSRCELKAIIQTPRPISTEMIYFHPDSDVVFVCTGFKDSTTSCYDIFSYDLNTTGGRIMKVCSIDKREAGPHAVLEIRPVRLRHLTSTLTGPTRWDSEGLARSQLSLQLYRIDS